MTCALAGPDVPNGLVFAEHDTLQSWLVQEIARLANPVAARKRQSKRYPTFLSVTSLDPWPFSFRRKRPM